MEQALIGEAPSIPGHAFGNIHGKLGHEPSVTWLVWSVQHLVNKRMLWAFLRYVSDCTLVLAVPSEFKL